MTMTPRQEFLSRSRTDIAERCKHSFEFVEQRVIEYSIIEPVLCDIQRCTHCDIEDRSYKVRTGATSPGHFVILAQAKPPWWKVICTCGVNWVGEATEESIIGMVIDHFIATVGS